MKLIKNTALRIYLIIVFFLFLEALSGILHAQDKSGSISGFVNENSTGSPIEGVDITIYSVKDSSLVKGTQTDASGKFIINNVPFGRYYIKVNMVGFNTAVISGVIINPTNLSVSLEPINLSAGKTITDEIIVEREKSQIEFHPDKKVFNIGKNITTQGSSVIDLLKNIPSVTVDQDNNISLRGSEGVKIMLDGRPSGLDGTNRGDMLAQIPATQVEKIELITNPSAKYEAEGSSGIINIILKKTENTGLGYNGTLGLNFGTGDKYNGQMSFTLKSKKFNLNGNYGYNSNQMKSGGLNKRYNFINTESYFTNETSSGKRRMLGHMLKLGLDIYFDNMNTLGVSVNYRNSERSRNDIANDLVYRQDGLLTSQFYNTTFSDDKGNNIDLALNYMLKFKTPQQIFTADISYSTDTDDDFTYTYETFITPVVPEPENRNETTREDDKALIGELNYIHPFGKNAKIETGYRGSFKSRDNDFIAEQFNYSTGGYITDLNRSNNFIYKEQINALYAIYTNKIGDFGFSLGTRVEHTIVKGELRNNSQRFDKSYVDFFPSASFSQKLSKSSEVQLSYSRRVNRPRFRQLNPFASISMMGGTNNLMQGNPNLDPEFTNSVELSYIYYLPFATLTPAVFYRHTANQIARTRALLDSLTTLTTFVNYNKSKSYGGEFILNTQPVKFWSLNGTFSFYKTEVDAANIGSGLTNSSYVWSTRASSTFTLPSDISLQLSYFYSGKNVSAQGTFDPFSMFDAALKKDFFDKRLSLTLRVSDVFETAKFKANINGSGFSEIFERTHDQRNFFLNLSYRFGQQEKKGTDRSKKRSNDNNNNRDDGMDF